jgi:hypothetical protein
MKPPDYIINAAKRGLELLDEAGDGLTEGTKDAARRMAAGEISDDKIVKANAWAERHAVDLDAGKNSNADDKEWPGAGAVAHYLWGINPLSPDAAREWFKRQAEKIQNPKSNFSEPRHYFAAIPGESRVDESNRVIRRVSLISEGDAKGHKDDDGRQVVVDQTCLDQIFEFCQSSETIKVKIDHGSGVFSTAGYVDNFFREASRVTANLHIYETEDEAPRIFEIARTNPRHMGISLEFIGEDEIDGRKILARCSEVMTAALVSDPAANRSLFFSQKCEKRVATILKNETNLANTEFMPPKKLTTDSEKDMENTTSDLQEESPSEPTLKEIAEQMTALASDYAAFKKAFETENPKLVTEDENDAGTEGEEPTEGIDPDVEPVGKGKAVLAKGNKMAADEEDKEEEKKMSRVIEATIKRLSASLGVKLPAAGAPVAIKSETPVNVAQKSFESELKRHEGNAAEAVKTFARVNPTAFKVWRDNGQPGLAKK